ncbi:hypothetical protein AX14_005419 [Amanita brunnescens Koide BX004]|nr:hypothetical protein AX14_005419 [Amanita brunnescens Koide BX004]
MESVGPVVNVAPNSPHIIQNTFQQGIGTRPSGMGSRHSRGARAGGLKGWATGKGGMLSVGLRPARIGVGDRKVMAGGNSDRVTGAKGIGGRATGSGKADVTGTDRDLGIAVGLFHGWGKAIAGPGIGQGKAGDYCNDWETAGSGKAASSNRMARAAGGTNGAWDGSSRVWVLGSSSAMLGSD